MTAGIFARVPTVAAIVVVALLATATLTLAATSSTPAPVAGAAEPVVQPNLVVPDVRRQAYVFAKGALEQAGFAWKVKGSVQGYAANVVAFQTPAPGTRMIANGAPIINLQLSQNSTYKQEGLPENASPYKGKPVKLFIAKPAVVHNVASTPVKPAAKPKAVPTPVAKPKAKTPTAPKTAAPAARKPAFAEAGAPREPLDEIALTARANKLGTWLDTHKTRTPRNVNHWLYQHNWIVTGAGFGWHDGSEALQELIRVDERVQKLWGVGGKSELVARRALAEVKARAR